MMMVPRRSKSQETLTTLINSTHETAASRTSADASFDQASLVSSQDTLIQPTTKIFNHPISQFHNYKKLPLTSCYLRPGITLYSPENHPQQQPLLTRDPKLFSNLFNFTSPFLAIETPTKQQYCRCDFKIYSNHITYYILNFPTTKQVLYLINNNSHYPSVDFAIHGTHMRITQGVSGTSTAFASKSGVIEIHVMRNAAGMLTEGMVVDDAKRKVKLDCELARLIQSQNRRGIDEVMRRARDNAVVSEPLAAFVDHGDIKVKGDGGSFVDHGVIKLWDYLSSSPNEPEGLEGHASVSEEMMMICCVLLVLREQESRKHKGDKKTGGCHGL
ncbi:uncharacterized protein LODBEIA_P42140 [Lodderomyces beijingensis]|uniref:Uncharacterized protein n=1 Tax=Lodderomyces beijingensis TaxID=1775926 RepID=A0ABP0ZUY8_9ASCO